MRKEISLRPGKWIWYPSQRTLPNTFVLFRQEFFLNEKPTMADGYIAADSRYELYVNGRRVQWGPAPCDPRCEEADPANILPYLQKGKNVLAVKVLFFAVSEGTWVAGNPGLLYQFRIHTPNLSMELVSDENVLCAVDFGHRPGQHQRWYLRAMQEEYDARRAEDDWNQISFSPGKMWKAAMIVGEDGSRPSIYNEYYEFISGGLRPQRQDGKLYERSIPMPLEENIPVRSLVEFGRVQWNTSVDDWFSFRSPNSFSCFPEAFELRRKGDGYTFFAGAGESFYLTFDFLEQIVGFPYFTITAPEGTQIELMVQESHQPHGENILLDTTFHCWSRFICKEGENRFQAFDFESAKWMQLHITAFSDGEISLQKLGVLRRKYPFEQKPIVCVKDPEMQRLFDAGINTIYNAAIETLVDGMGRERQQYAGDGLHALTSIRQLFGNYSISRRLFDTYADGMTSDGYFLDCYPAGDRLKRVGYKQIGLSYWGPLIDHSVGFVIDCYKYVYATGDMDSIEEVYPKLKIFVEFLRREAGKGLFPVEDTGSYCVWLDHHAFLKQRHRLGCMNIFIYGMLRWHFIPLMQMMEPSADTETFERFADQLQNILIERFWDKRQKMFWDNLPWLDEEKEPVVSDRTLAMAILYGLCPGGEEDACANYLAYNPNLRLSYPCNAVWRQWALSKNGYANVILGDLRSKWATMPSVRYNNAYQEHWIAYPDSTSEWSHIPQAPLIAVGDVFVGIYPTAPGYETFNLRPQLWDLGDFETVLHTVRGEVKFQAKMVHRLCYRIQVQYPSTMTGLLQMDRKHRVEGLKKINEILYELPRNAEFILTYQEEDEYTKAVGIDKEEKS